MPLYRIVKALEDKDSLGLSPGEWVYDKMAMHTNTCFMYIIIME